MNIYLNQINTATEQNLLPLSAGLIASSAKSNGEIRQKCDFHIRVQRGDPKALASAFDDPFVLGFSCYSWNLRQSLKVAQAAKNLYPRCHVVFGGPEIPRSADGIRRFFPEWTFVDSLVPGEGEITFRELILALLNGTDLTSIAGLAFQRGEGEVHVNTPRGRIDNFGELPSPFLDGTFDEFLAGEPRPLSGALWETNRGCPFSCTFCDWGQATKSRVREVPLERLRREIEWIGQRQFHLVWATDANFGIRPQDLQIGRCIAGAKRIFGYPRALSVSWAKNCPDRVGEIYEVLAEAEIDCQITLTMQSFHRETLAAVKRSNIKLASFDALKESFGNLGIPTYSEFILPLPEETYDTFMDGVIRSLTRYWRDFFAINLCRLIPNTEMASQQQRELYAFETRTCEIKVARRITTCDSVSEFEELLVGTRTMPIPEWAKTVQAAFLLSALFNHRLADVILNVLKDHFGVQIKYFIAYVLWETESNTPIIQRIRETLLEHIDSILNSNSPMVRVREYGEYYWEPNESAYLVAALDIPAFLAELKHLTISYLSKGVLWDGDLNIIENLFAFQSSSIPRFTRRYPFQETFSWDWLSVSRQPNARFDVDAKGEFTYSFGLHEHDQSLVLNDQCVRGQEPQPTSAERAFVMAQIKVTSTGKNAVCKVESVAARTTIQHDACQAETGL